MTISPHSFPPPKTLIRFLSERMPVTINEVSTLVGFSRAWVFKRAEVDCIAIEGEQVPWDDVMTWMLRAWPLAVIEDALPPDARELLPRLLGTTSVTWRLPRYVVTAMEHQAAKLRASETDAHDITVEQYVADELHRIVIREDTVAELGDDFRAAYFFPEEL